MTPQEKLKEIEKQMQADYPDNDYDNLLWLISRVKELEKACQEITVNVGCKKTCKTETELSFCYTGCRAVLISEKALRG